MPRRAGTHMRGNRVSGNPNRLNENAIKVLASVRFAPSSMSREELMRDANLSREDVERQTKLLLRLQLIRNNSRFPPFPNEGWKVYTEREKNALILNILQQHGYTPPTETSSRQILGDYYPTGLALDGTGQQPNRGQSYTKGVPIIEQLEFRESTIAIMDTFKKEKKPFRPKVYSEDAVKIKKKKWEWFVNEMARNYGIDTPRIEWGAFSEESWSRPGASYKDDFGRSSYYSPSNHTLFFTGRFSVITLIHEFGHARGFDERDTIIWSTNLMKRTFPVSFSKLQGEEGSHVLQSQRQRPFEL